MTTHQTFYRQVTTTLLSAAVWINLALPPAVAFAGEQVQSAGSMSVPRRGHTATVLADGRVLLLGGLDASGPLSAAEIFDPASKTFTLAGNLANPRYGHSATLLANGRVLIAGGQDASGPLATAEIFDPADSTTPFRLLTAKMGAARVSHTATLRSDGTVLLAGGEANGTAEIFDPVTETFYTPLLNMAAPRVGHTATPLADDNVFLVGGGNASIELYNAASNSFTLWPQGLSQIRSGHSSIPTTDGKLLVIGGDQTGSFELFDPVTGSNPLSLSLGTPSTTANLLANNKILVLGPGVSGLFDETTSQLSALTDTNAAALQLSGHTATELPTANKQILVAGGIDSSNNLLNAATIYNPAVIATDAGDYPPFSWVNITGQGFLPNETVTNQVEQIQGPAAGTSYAPWGVNADTNGAFTTAWQVFSDELLNTTLKLSAAGQTSGLRAETEFTDASSVTSVSVGSQSPSPVCAGSSATYSITVNRSGNGGLTVNLSVSNTLPAGVTAVFSPNPLVFSGNTASLPSTMTVSTPVSLAGGTYAFKVFAADGSVTVTNTAPTLVVTTAPSTPTAGNNGPICAGSTLNLTATTVSGATYSWTGPNGFTSTQQNPSIPNATVGASGSYSVTATVGACTSAAGTTSVTVNARPTATVSGTTTICNGSSATVSAALTGKGPWNVSWFDGTTTTVHSGVGGTGTTGTDTLTVSPSSAKTYTVTALTDANCTAQAGDLTGSAVVSVNARPTAAVSGTTTICNGSSATVSAALTGKGPWNVSWFDGTTTTVHSGVGGTGTTGTDTLTVSPSSAKTYTVTALTDANCTAQAGDLTGSAVVSVNARPTSAVSGTTTICNGGSAVVSAALTGKGPWNVSWFDGTTTTVHSGVGGTGTTGTDTLTVSSSSTKTYTVTVLTDANCTAQAGDRTGSAVVTVNARPTAAVSGTTTICNGSSATVSAALTGKGPWNVSWFDGTTTTVHSGVGGTGTSGTDTLTVSPSSAKTYTVTALTDANCTAQPGDLTGSAVVSVNARPTSVVSGTTTICNGGSAVVSAALTGQGPWNVSWFDGTTTTVHSGVGGTGTTGTDTLTVSPSSTKTYTVTVLTDANCTAQAGDRTGSAVVTVNARPTAAVSGTTTICNGSSATVSAALTGKGPWNVSWFDGTTTTVHSGVGGTGTTGTDTLTVSPSSAKTYTVTALTDANCTAQAGDLTGSAVVSVNARPTAAVSGTTTICNGSSATVSAALTGKGPWNVSWFDGTTTTVHSGVGGTGTTGTDTLTVSPSSAKTYTVTALTDANCTAQPGDLTGSAVVSVNARPTAAVSGTQTICNGQSALLTLTVTGSGTISGTLSGGTPFSGTAPTISVSVSPTATTSYTVASLSDANCTATAADLSGSATVTVNQKSAAPTSATASSATICNGQSATLTLVGGGGGAGETIHWYTGSCGGTPAGTGNGVSVSPTTTTTYFGRYEDGAPCNFNTTCASVTVTVNQKSADPTSATAGSSIICNGQSTALTLNGGGGGTGETIHWYTGSCGGTSVGTGNGLSVSPATTTTYFGRYEDGTPCNFNSACAAVTVTVNARPTAVVSGSGTICTGSSATIQAALTGSGPWDVTWSDGLVQSAVASSPATRSVTPSANTTYTVTALSDSKCTAQPGDLTGSAALTLNPTPTLGLTETDVSCNGGNNGTVTANISGGTQLNGHKYNVSIDGGLSAPQMSGFTFPSLGAGVHTVLVQDANGCTATQSIMVNQPSPVVANAGLPQTICAGGSANIGDGPTASGGTPGYSYSWTPSTGLSSTTVSNPTASPTSTTTYTVTVTDANGCTAVSTVKVTVNPLPTTSAITGSASVCANQAGVTYSVTLTSGSSYAWTVPTGATITAGQTGPNNNSITVTFGSTSVNVTVTETANTSCVGATKTLAVTVNPPSVGGTATATASPICSGSSTTISLTGQTGSIVKWQSSPDGSTWTDIASTANPLNTGTLTATTQFRAVVQSGPCSSVNSSVAIVTVGDTTPPSITTCAPAQTISANSGCQATVPDFTATTVASDNCTASGSLIKTQNPTAGTLVGLGDTTITITVKDASGNSVQCTSTLTVKDTTAPSVLCPAGTTASADANCQGAVPNVLPGVTASDNCTPTPSLIITQNPIAGTLVGLGTTTITVSAKDAAGNTGTCTTTFTVNDTTPPVITCPSDVTTTNAPGVCTSKGNLGVGTATATDNCTPSGSITITANRDDTHDNNLNAAFQVGVTHITWTAQDAAGNTATCIQTITINDVEKPVITCPANITVNASPGLSTSNVTFTVTATDNCAIQSIVSVPASGSAFSIGTTTVNSTATDIHGNISTCSFTVTVIDNQPPSITCPPTSTVQCASAVPPPATDYASFGVAGGSASDNSGVNPSITFVSDVTNAMTCPNRFTITRTYKATDGAGNTTTCTQTITVNDTTNPTVTKGTIASCYKSLAAADAAALAATTGSSFCGGTMSFSVMDNGQTCPATITVKGTDECGNSTSVTYSPTILTTAPVLSGCPADELVHCAADIPAVATVTAKDACGTTLTVIPNQTQSDPGGCTNVITRTWTTTDCAGNSSSCTQIVTLHTDTAPTVNKGSIASCYKSLAAADAAALAATTGSSFCGGTMSFSVMDNGQTCPATITVTGTDPCGNSTSVTYSPTILTTAPVLSGCPADELVHCAADIPAVATVTAKDACGTTLTVIPNQTQSDPGGCTNVITRTWTTTDCAGNSSSCTQIVTLHTDTAPTVNKGSIASCYKSLAAADAAALAATTGSSFCGGTMSFSVMDNGQTCPATITVTGTDPCGNSTSVTYSPTILTTAPVLSGCPADELVHCAADIPAVATVTAKDACGTTLTVIPNQTQSDPGGCTNVITRTWTTTDCAGNSSSCTQIVTLHTDTAPTVNKGSIASCYKSLAAADAAALAATTGSSFCGGTMSFSVMDNGQTCPATITVKGTDECGNSTSVTYSPTILTTAPVLSGCPVDELVHCAADVPAVATVTAKDACGTTLTVIPNQTQSDPGGCTNVITRTWTTTDCAGNSSSCTQVITLHTDTAPTVTKGAIASCYKSLAAADAAALAATTGSSFCGGTMSFSVMDNGQTCPATITVKGTDECGNSTSVTYSPTILTTAPVLSGCPADELVHCAADIPAVATVTAKDACGTTLTVIPNQTQSDPGGCTNVITRTWTTTDCAGNSSSCTQIVTLHTDTAPTVNKGSIASCYKSLAAADAAALAATTGSSFCGGTMSFSVMDNGQTCPATITVTGTDPCGNSTSVTYSPTILTTAPVLSGCPVDELVHCAADVPAVATVTAKDACGTTLTVIPNQTQSDPGGCTNVITRTWTTTDCAGNSSSCTQVITLHTDTAPTVTKGAIASCYKSLAAADAAALAATTGSSFCGGTMSFSVMDNGQTCPATITVKGTDECGNSTSVTYSPTILTTAPVLSGCPADELVHCAADIPAVATVTAKDACGTTLTVIPNQTQSDPGGCTNVITRTWTTTDCAGNSSSCTQVITLHTDTAPTVTKGAIASCYKSLAAADVAALAATTGSSFCGGTMSFSVMDNGQTCPATITVTGTDPCGNSTSVTYSPTILTTPPVLSGCPVDELVHCAADVPAVATVTAKDACGTTLTVIPNQTQSDPGGCTNVITRTWTTTDCAGNSSSCTQIVTLHTDTAPTVNKGSIASCYKSLAAADAAALAATTGSSFCGGTMNFSVMDNGQTCPATITVKGTDECGNSTSVTYSPTILTTAPVLSGCPADELVHCAADIPAVATVTAKDACGTTLTVIPNQTQSDPGGCTNVITRTWTTTDCAGNSSSCTQVITLHTDTAPTVTKGAIASCYKSLAAADAAALAATTGSSFCGGTMSFSVMDNGQTCPATITVTGTDPCGNSTSVIYNPTILTTPPVLSGCPTTPVLVHCAANIPIAATVTAVDACGSALVVNFNETQSNPGGCTNVITRTWTTTDCAGNSSSCTQVITLHTDTAPMVTCPAPITVDCASKVPTPDTSKVTATANCGGPVTVTFVGDVISAQTCANRFIITRTYRAVDNCGNMATCSQTITVNDTTPPMITCPANITQGTDPGQCSATVSVGTATATDNCGAVSVVGVRNDTLALNAPYPKGVTIITWTATDACGLTSSCAQTVTVNDTENPKISCPANITQGTDPGKCSAMVNVGTATATDNCPGVSVAGVRSDTLALSAAYPKGVTTITWTATDTSGNKTVCTQTVTVNDTEKPVITCAPDVNVSTGCTGSTLVTVPKPTVSDNCGVASVLNSYNNTGDASGSYPLGVTTITWTVTDTSGNVATCTQHVTVTFLAPNCNPMSSAVNKARIHFHHDGTSYADFQGSLTLLNGMIPDDLRDAPVAQNNTSIGHGKVKVIVANKVWYCNDSLVFNVSGVDPNNDTEKWDYHPTGPEEVMIMWKNNVQYQANNDPQVVKSVFGTLISRFIHQDKTELRWNNQGVALPATLSYNGQVVVNLSATGVATAGLGAVSIDQHGTVVDFDMAPLQLAPGDQVTWNTGIGTATPHTYTQTIGSGTATQVYYNAGGSFDIRVPRIDSTIVSSCTPLLATVQLQVGDSITACTTFNIVPSDPLKYETDEHWKFHDDDDE